MNTVRDERRHDFTIIQNSLLASDISCNAKMVYIVLASFAWEKSKCFPGMASVAKRASLSVSTVQRAIVELESKKWISVTTGRATGKSNEYTLFDGWVGQVDRGVGQVDRGVGQVDRGGSVRLTNEEDSYEEDTGIRQNSPEEPGDVKELKLLKKVDQESVLKTSIREAFNSKHPITNWPKEGAAIIQIVNKSKQLFPEVTAYNIPTIIETFWVMRAGDKFLQKKAFTPSMLNCMYDDVIAKINTTKDGAWPDMPFKKQEKIS